jgi:hypothetical protein
MATKAETVGTYLIQTAEGDHAFAVNTLNRVESDLAFCVAGRWRNWLDETSLRLEYQNIAWILLLLALAVLTLHLALVARGSGRART